MIRWLAALVVLLWPALALAEAPVFQWGAGSKTGGFTKISKAIADGLENTGGAIDIEIHNTKGSCDNIKRLLHGELDFALVQYDVAAEAYKASRAITGDDEAEEGEEEEAAGGFMCDVSADIAAGVELRLITALTQGAVHVLVRRPVRIDSFESVVEHPIYIGSPGSGSFETAKVIVGAAGLTVDSLNRFDGKSSAAFKALRNEELLVMLRTTEPGHESIEYEWAIPLAEATFDEVDDTQTVDVYGILPHMHQRGTGMEVRFDIEQEETCGAHVDRWDFNWQRMYFYEEPITMTYGDTVRVTCDFDTSADTKPVLPGFGTDDEMCLLGLYIVPR